MVRFSSLGLTLDVKLFRDELRRLIATEEDTDPFVVNRFVNRDEVEIEGVETQLDWRPSQQVRVFLSHGYADADNAAVVPDDAGYKLLQSVPTHTFSLLAMLRPNPASDLSLGYYLTSEQLWLGNGDLIPARRRLDLRAARRFELGSSRLELAAVIQNLLDPYTDFLDDPDHPAERNVFDRRMFLTVQLEF
jgi:outer membrane receptor protein involved in Fe transport